MERCVRPHRFSALLCLSLCLSPLVRGSHRSDTPRRIQALPAQSLFGAAAAAELHSAQFPSRPPQQRKTEEYTLSRERYEKAVAYSRASYFMYFVAVFLAVFILMIILRLGIAAKYRDWAERVSDNRGVQALIFVPLLLLSLGLVELPLHAYGHVLSVHYEMSVQKWGSWFLDWSKEQLLMIGFGFILALILTAIMRKSPRRWWLHFWFAALPVIVFLMFITPWFIDPLFNKFEPLQATHPELVASIEKLTAHAGEPIPPQRMFLMKASEKTNALDAYVTGIGSSKRLVIWDTTIQKTTPYETLYIVSHELGHYVLGHVWKGFLFAAALLLVGFYALYRALHWALGRWSGEWKIYGLEDWASLAVLLLFVEMGMFLASPIVNGFSRMQEHAADIYGLEVTHGIIPNSSEVAAQSFQVLGETDLADPNPSPFITLWLYSHPPLAERLAFAFEYDPWSKGEPPKYVK